MYCLCLCPWSYGGGGGKKHGASRRRRGTACALGRGLSSQREVSGVASGCQRCCSRVQVLGKSLFWGYLGLPGEEEPLGAIV